MSRKGRSGLGVDDDQSSGGRSPRSDSRKRRGSMSTRQFLREPNTTKKTDSKRTQTARFGSCSQQGWRAGMEDAHNAAFNFEGTPCGFFAVYDGHGGKEVAQLCAKKLGKRIVQREEWPYPAEGKQAKKKRGSPSTAESDERSVAISIQKAVTQLDMELYDGRHALSEKSPGTTACMVVVTPENIICGNIGDSRCVACIKGKAVALSEDHKPSNPDETDRIERAGANVVNERIDGMLSVSRSIGDIRFKKRDVPFDEQPVVAMADFSTIPLESARFLVIACDGIWEVMDNDEVVRFVEEGLQKKPATAVAADLVSNCTATSKNEKLGFDNMTVIIVEFFAYDAFAESICEAEEMRGVHSKSQAFDTIVEENSSSGDGGDGDETTSTTTATTGATDTWGIISNDAASGSYALESRTSESEASASSGTVSSYSHTTGSGPDETTHSHSSS